MRPTEPLELWRDLVIFALCISLETHQPTPMSPNRWASCTFMCFHVRLFIAFCPTGDEPCQTERFKNGMICSLCSFGSTLCLSAWVHSDHAGRSPRGRNRTTVADTSDANGDVTELCSRQHRAQWKGLFCQGPGIRTRQLAESTVCSATAGGLGQL